MKPNDSLASDSALAQSARGRWRYFALFVMQTIGAVLLYWTGLLLYRQVLVDPTSNETHPWTLVWALSSIALMQIAYWVSYHVRPPLARFSSALLGHAILFLARMGFVLPTSVFGFVFVQQRLEFEIPIFKCLVILLGLFALYCYVRELERLSRAFIA
jgi:hypothetical protein